MERLRWFATTMYGIVFRCSEERDLLVKLDTLNSIWPLQIFAPISADYIVLPHACTLCGGCPFWTSYCLAPPLLADQQQFSHWQPPWLSSGEPVQHPLKNCLTLPQIPSLDPPPLFAGGGLFGGFDPGGLTLDLGSRFSASGGTRSLISAFGCWARLGICALGTSTGAAIARPLARQSRVIAENFILSMYGCYG